jgi:hypothetical protein
MGHDSERAAMIYQHEGRADRAITDAIDTHVRAERDNDESDDDTAGGFPALLQAKVSWGW